MRFVLLALIAGLGLAVGCGDDDNNGGLDADTASDTDTDTGTDSSSDSETESETNEDLPEDCTDLPDFTICKVMTDPDRSYDICVNDVCVSPGCGDDTCNAPYPHFPLADTNLRQCYNNEEEINCPSIPTDDYYGQDAQYGWDTSHEQGERYTRDNSHSDEPVIMDNVTGLVWQGCPMGLSGDSCEEGDESKINWQGALAYCEDLTWGEHTDWRLPDEFEVTSIVDLSMKNPDPGFFPGYGWGPVWSSSSNANDESEAWHAYLRSGIMTNEMKTSNFSVLCVRGKPSTHSSRFIRDVSISGQPLVKDNVTGLEWQGCAGGFLGDNCETETGSGGEYTWQAALTYCESLDWGGYADWRLPNKNELGTIVDNRMVCPSIDSEVFPNTPYFVFWSSSSHAGQNQSQAWYVSFNLGTGHYSYKINPRNVRCVRSGL